MIHEAGKIKEDVQSCCRCGEVLFTLISSKKFKAPKRYFHVKNSTTKPISITASGFKPGSFILVTPNKKEVTEKQPTCKKQ